MKMTAHADPLWGRWAEFDDPDMPLSPDSPDVAVRIVDHDNEVSYIVKVDDQGDRAPARILGLWRAPQDLRAEWSELGWLPDQAVAELARLFLRRWWESHQRNAPTRSWAVHYAEHEVLDGALTSQEVAIQVRAARAKGVPIVKWFTEDHGHPWRLSERTAARRIAEARAEGLLPEEQGVRGPGDKSRSRR